MPHICLQLSGAPDATCTAAAVAQVQQLTQQLLGKDPALISVAVQQVPAHNWWVGGQTLADLQQSAFYLQISVTDETNTKAEKARYLQAVHAAMAALLPQLHPVSYIHIVDARAATYGYGGLTQEHRWQHPAR